MTRAGTTATTTAKPTVPVTVRAYNARTSTTNAWTAGSMILDTGATAQLMKTTVNNLLAHQRASDLEVQAAFGTRRKRAAIHGQARMYILNTSEPEQRGTPLEHSVDTLDDLNDDLPVLNGPVSTTRTCTAISI